jgi:thiamine transporter ThiT
MGTEAGLFLLVIIAAVGMLVYFVPCLVASRRNHRNAMPIFILNLFLGWTFVGWVGALVWAMTDNVKADAPTAPGA